MLTKEQRDNFDIDPVIKFCYDYILPITDDRVLATHGAEISLITKSGDMVCTYDSIQVPTYNDPDNCEFNPDYNCDESGRAYVDDFLLIIQDGMYGLIDYDGNIVIDPKYSVLRFVSQDKMELFE